jgi:hypothetical protein
MCGGCEFICSAHFYLVFFILNDIMADKEKGGGERSDSYYC